MIRRPAAANGGAAIVGLTLLTTVGFIFVKAWPALTHVNFFTKDMAGVRPTQPLDQGGILHAAVGSAIEVAIAVVIALPRQVCMYLARKCTRHSLEEIGGFFGGRDHTTVMHALRTIDSKRADDGAGTRSDHVCEGAFELVGTPNLDDLQRHVLPGRPLPFL